VEAVTLTEFLLARITEDEAVAQQASKTGRLPVPSRGTEGYEAVVRSKWRVTPGAPGVKIEPENGWCIYGPLSEGGDNDGGADEFTAPHIARWDPARVFAECEAKRRIVAAHPMKYLDRWDCSVCDACANEFNDYWIVGGGPCPTLILLALPYADHPDYQESWKP
jgi:hypothetical protein